MSTVLRSALPTAAVAALGLLAPAAPLAAEPAFPVVTIVKVAKPWYAPGFLLVSKFRDTIPQYEAIPGLHLKIYTLSRDGAFGGIYLWQDRTAAEAWFNAAWFQRVREQRGVEGRVQYLEAPVVLDNVSEGTPTTADGRTVASLVTIPVPVGVSRAQLIAGFRQALPIYRQVPGLLRKYFILTADGKFGGVYLWKDESSARAHYSEAWQAEAKKRYGTAPTVEFFDAPVLTASRLPENRTKFGQP